jgi:hypothetical protein
MRPDSTEASTSGRPSAPRWWRQREGTSASRARRAPRASRSAFARATPTTRRTYTSRRSPCTPGRACRRATASAPSGRPEPARPQRRTCTSASATRAPTTATTTRSPSCRRHRRRHPRPRRGPPRLPRPSRWNPNRHPSLPHRRRARGPVRSGGPSHDTHLPPRAEGMRRSHRARRQRHSCGPPSARASRRSTCLAGLYGARPLRCFRTTTAHVPNPRGDEPRRRLARAPWRRFTTPSLGGSERPPRATRPAKPMAPTSPGRSPAAASSSQRPSWV